MRFFFVFHLIVFFYFAVPAQAQWILPGEPEDWKASLGLGAGLRPDFPGAKTYKVTPIPFFDLSYKRRFFLNTGRGLGMFLYGDKDGRLKYLLGVGFGPSFDTRSRDDIAGLDKVGLTALGRVFGEVFFDAWSVELTVAKDLIGQGHEGLWADVGLNYTKRFKEFGLFRIGPQVRFGSGDYMDAFYSVTLAQAPRADLPVFDAGNGFERIGGGAFLSYPIAEHWNVVSAARYFRLVTDAADSPVVRDKDQFGLFLALAYRF